MTAELLVYVFSYCVNFRFTCVLGFNRMLTELNDIAGQHETVAEKLTNVVILTLQSSIHDIKRERKKVSITRIFCMKGE